MPSVCAASSAALGWSSAAFVRRGGRAGQDRITAAVTSCSAGARSVSVRRKDVRRARGGTCFKHQDLVANGVLDRAVSRPRGSFQRNRSHGEAVAPLPEEGAGECEVDAAPHTKPCWADKWLKLPEGGFCHVPWKGGTVVSVMILWFASFLLVGHIGLPSAVRWLGFNCRELSTRGLALYSLSADVVEMFVGLGVLYQCLRPYFPLPERWFPVSLKGKWWKEVLLGCTVFPIVSTLNNLNSSLMPIPSSSLPASPWEQSLLSNDIVSILFYVAVVSFVAPIWEEFIFRGFLLPSFTRYFRLDLSILLSSLVFALAHFSTERLIPLTFLGMLMCVVYIRSKNILAPIILHSLWNAFAFVELIVKPDVIVKWVANMLGYGI